MSNSVKKGKDIVKENLESIDDIKDFLIDDSTRQDGSNKKDNG